MSKVKVFHIRSDFGVALSLAVKKHEEGIVYGIAVCSPKDQFNRRVGRAICTGRLEKRPLFAENLAEMAEVIKNYLYKSISIPATEACNLSDSLDRRVKRARCLNGW